MKASHFIDVATAPARALSRARLQPMRTKLRAAAAAAFVAWASGCSVESELAARNDPMGNSGGSMNASGGGHSMGGVVECNPDVEAFCATAVCSRTPGEGDCGQEYSNFVGNEGHWTGCGLYRMSILDDTSQGEIHIYDEETGELVYYLERHYEREVVTTEVGCEPACDDWEVIPCPYSPMGGGAGQ